MVLSYISVEGWIVHPDINSFFYGCDEVVVLSPHNAEILDGDIMTCDVMMVMYWGGGLLITFYYILFTSVPIEPSIKIIKQQLEKDKELHQRTSISVQHIIMLLEFCLKNTHLSSKEGSMNRQKELPWDHL